MLTQKIYPTFYTGIQRFSYMYNIKDSTFFVFLNNTYNQCNPLAMQHVKYTFSYTK